MKLVPLVGHPTVNAVQEDLPLRGREPQDVSSRPFAVPDPYHPARKPGDFHAVPIRHAVRALHPSLGRILVIRKLHGSHFLPGHAPYIRRPTGSCISAHTCGQLPGIFRIILVNLIYPSVPSRGLAPVLTHFNPDRGPLIVNITVRAHQLTISTHIRSRDDRRFG
jgi:hypothetical protein